MSPVKEMTPSEKGNTNDKKVEAIDLLTELRHKYITILKSLYWEHFEDG